MINNAPMVFTIGTQEKIITFLSNWVKESKLKILDFRSYLKCGHFSVTTMSYQKVALLNTRSYVNLNGKEVTQLG